MLGRGLSRNKGANDLQVESFRGGGRGGCIYTIPEQQEQASSERRGKIRQKIEKILLQSSLLSSFPTPKFQFVNFHFKHSFSVLGRKLAGGNRLHATLWLVVTG